MGPADGSAMTECGTFRAGVLDSCVNWMQRGAVSVGGTAGAYRQELILERPTRSFANQMPAVDHLHHQTC